MTAVGYWPPWTGISSNNAALEQVIRANSLDQMTPPQATLLLNNQRLASAADPVNPQDVATSHQSYAGWSTDPNAWTRTGNTTFTQAANTTAYMVPGTKLRWQESAVQKYGVVATATFGAGTTTVTLAPTSDFVMAATPDGGTQQYSYGKPVDFPTSFTWVPTNTGFSANPNNTGSFWAVSDGLVTITYFCFTNGTSNATTYTITNLPIPQKASQGSVATGNGVDSGAATAVAGTISGTTLTLVKGSVGSSSPWTASGAKSADITMSYPI